MSPASSPRIGLTLLLFVLLVSVLTLPFTGGDGEAERIPDPIEGTVPGDGFLGEVTVPFIANRGQVNEDIAYLAHTFGGIVSVTAMGDIVYWLPMREPGTGGAVLRERFVGGNSPKAEGRVAGTAKVSFFKGRDRSKWQSRIPTYHEVALGEVFEGIEVTLRAHGDNVEKLFCVHAGGDPSLISVAVEGATSLTARDDGRLEAATDLGRVTFTRPLAYQEAQGGRDYVEVAYAVTGETYGFDVGPYDAAKPLIIDPLLASTFLGGSDGDGQFESPMRLSDDGYVYVANRTKSSDFPFTAGVYDSLLSGASDGYVAKLDAGLTTLVAATYLGGAGNEGGWPGFDLILDGEGNVLVTGQTKSADFPTTPGAYRSTNAGAGDLFIAKLSGDLDSLLASTMIGGTNEESFGNLAIGPGGDVFASAGTESPDFPYVSGCFDTTYGGGGQDVVVFRMDAGLTTLKASTFMGVAGYDGPEAIATDEAGDLYVTGWTASSAFPTTTGAYAETYNGGYYDAFVSKLNPDLTSVLASTFLGGAKWDFGYYLALGPAGKVYVTGHTASNGTFPWSPGAYDSTYNGFGIQGTDDDAFLSIFDSDLTTLMASTYLGGSEWENGEAIDVDANGTVYLAGYTRSGDFPTTPQAFDRTHGEPPNVAVGDVFITRFNGDLTGVTASTFLGGGNVESAGDIMLDGEGHLFISGSTSSPNFPTTPAAYDTTFNGGASIGGSEDRGGDLFVAIIDTLLSEAGASVGEGPEGRLTSLGRCWPNPFRTATAVRFALAEEADAVIGIYDVTGRLVRVLADGRLTSGDHSVAWNGRDSSGRRVAAGIYFCRLEVARRVETSTVVYVR